MLTLVLGGFESWYLSFSPIFTMVVEAPPICQVLLKNFFLAVSFVYVIFIYKIIYNYRVYFFVISFLITSEINAYYLINK